MNNKLIVKKLTTSTFVMLICALAFGAFASKIKVGAPAQPSVEIKQIEAQKAVVIKVTIPTADVGQKMGELYGKLFGYLAENSIQPTGIPFAVYYEYNPQGNTVFEVGVPISASVKGNDEITYKEFPAMKVVSILYVGPYEKVGPTYEMLQKYLKDNNLQSTGSTWEVYLTNPQQEQDPNKYQTIIYFPIK